MLVALAFEPGTRDVWGPRLVAECLRVGDDYLHGLHRVLCVAREDGRHANKFQVTQEVVTQLRLLQPPAVPSLSVEEPPSPSLLSETTLQPIEPSAMELSGDEDLDELSVIEVSDDEQ